MIRRILLVSIVVLPCAATTISTTISTSWPCNAGSDVTEFPACNKFLNFGDSCATVLGRPAKQDCLCNQDYLDSLYACENELHLCYLNDDLDDTFESGVMSWDSLCGSVVTFSPTTLSASPYTAHPDQLCAEVKKTCLTGHSLIDECLSYVSDEDTSSFSSCTCQPQLLRLDYSCHFIGNASCLVTDVALSSLRGYSECDNFASVIGTGLVSVREASP
ncbi:hypothetical protein FALBO_10349 [Fusarium albosuccineum]|uniref:Extracellular membrane protein CFEM domain-containing protein n=1 Tax=Fusarium albosuccineum TaxID=1237068 RepID=A0A8H4L663_9HYPO|nr:hypothetical protein FALBO_10349 [Fusarium albosuccineum]